MELRTIKYIESILVIHGKTFSMSLSNITPLIGKKISIGLNSDSERVKV